MPDTTHTDEPTEVARSGRSGRDMAISLLVLLIPLAIVVAFFRFRGGEDVIVVDPAPTIGQARAAGAFPVLTPQGLAEGWRPLSASFRTEPAGATLRVGYLTPGGGTLQLIESSEVADPLLIREFGENSRPTGVASAGGHDWTTYAVRNNETAWAWPQPGRVIILIGNAPPEDFTTLAASLR